MMMGHEGPPTSILTPEAAPVDCRLPLRRMEDDAMPRAAEEEVAARNGPNGRLASGAEIVTAAVVVIRDACVIAADNGKAA